MRRIIRKIIPYNIRKKYKNIKNQKKIDIYKLNPKKLMIDGKKVSVIIPNNNYENFIEERIDSVLKQTYPIYELIILDDCSIDNSVKKIMSVMEKYEGIIKYKIVVNKENSKSVFSQWQKGFKESNGDYI